MKVALATTYRVWMFALLPATLGVGTLALWAQSLNWPLSVDEDGITLRHRRRIPWASIKAITVRRHYCDGHISQVDIRHRGSTSKIPVHALHDGQNVATEMIALFKQARRVHSKGQNPRLGAAVHSDGKVTPIPREKLRRGDLVNAPIDVQGTRVVARSVANGDTRNPRYDWRGSGDVGSIRTYSTS